MEQPQIQHGVTAQLFIPCNAVKTYAAKAFAAGDPAGTPPQEFRAYQALAITEGKFNGTVFTAEELTAMVDRINASDRINRIRIVEEHNDSVGALLGRATSLQAGTVIVDGNELQGVTIGFTLFDRLQKQRDVITQLEQAPDLIGLSVAISGDLIPTEVYQNEEIVDIDWTWKDIDLIHVALVTYPACSATEGTIAAAYKTADGAVFNPSFFTYLPTSKVMETTPDTGAMGASVSSPAIAEQPAVQAGLSAEDAKAIFKDIAKAGSLSARIGIEPNADLIVSLSADQRKAYLADLEQIAAKFAEATVPKTSDDPLPEKGAEFGQPQASSYKQQARDLINGTGAYADFGKHPGSE